MGYFKRPSRRTENFAACLEDAAAEILAPTGSVAYGYRVSRPWCAASIRLDSYRTSHLKRAVEVAFLGAPRPDVEQSQALESARLAWIARVEAMAKRDEEPEGE